MKILITGADGQLGKSLQLTANSPDHQITALNRTRFDLTNPQQMQNVLEAVSPDIVINTAAWTNVDGAETNEKTAFAINEKGTGDLAELCAQKNIVLIHISTDYVYDGASKDRWNETDKTRPQTIYGRSKLAGEKAIRDSSVRHLILRTSWVYSPFGANFLKTMLLLAGERDEISVVFDQIGCPTYAPHLATGIMQIVRAISKSPQHQYHETFCLAGTEQISWATFAQEIFRQSKQLQLPFAKVVPIPSSDYSTTATRPQNSALDCNLIAERFAVKLPSFKVGIKECLQNYELKNPACDEANKPLLALDAQVKHK
ncbi:MAG: dTDP-4-dehydrorhamnose reductase [Robiginitomaculum sp.]|nr:dTDP-4-dehydrorhamnose reductase [Robiginitomaculum sp.]